MRELEQQNDYTQREVGVLSDKVEKLERENMILRKTNEGTNDV